MGHGPPTALTLTATGRSPKVVAAPADRPVRARQPPIVGSPEQVADQLIAWMNVDGFSLPARWFRNVWRVSFDLVLPILQERGAYRRDYTSRTYRQKLFGRGDRLPDEHPATTARWIEYGM
jgi:hypothetical protein